MTTNKSIDPTEEWRPVKGFEGFYEVGSLGSVRSLPRQTLGRWGKPKTTPGGVLLPELSTNGYMRIFMSKHGILKRVLVHRLVAEAFIPNPENKPTVNHKDGVKHNNTSNNLEWATSSEQQLHAYSTGLHQPTRGIKSFNGKKTECLNGHPLSGDNVRWRKDGTRNCKTCEVTRRRRNRAELRKAIQLYCTGETK